MLLSSLLLIPVLGVFAILVNKDNGVSLTNIKFIALTTSILNLFISLLIFILFDFSTNQFQFVQEYHEIRHFDFYLGVDGLSIYFVLLTTIIIPISLLSNWTSISRDVQSYVIIILLLETLLLAVFLVLDILLFYIFFESILPPLFILIGIFGSDNRVKASFYLFLYTLLGSLFLLLSILAMSSIMSTTDFDTLFKGNFLYITQLFLFYGIFIAFAVKTPTIFLNTWLLKAHVESPLGGSIILAAIVLKLSLYGILRLILPILPKAYMEYTYIIYLIGVITIIYASLSTLRTIDVKELIAYSSVSHAAVYLLAVFSNNIQGIEGSINLGLAHGLVSPGLFICAGGVLYDRSHTRLVAFYRGMAQVMPLFAILFFILCLANCGAPLSLNFIGEFLSLYGVFERSSLFGLFASSSIIFSAGYSIYMYQKISFGGSYSRMFIINIPDLTKREFMILLTLVVPTVIFGIYPAPILDGIHYSVSTLIYSFDFCVINCDISEAWQFYLRYSANSATKTIFLIGITSKILHSYYNTIISNSNFLFYYVKSLLLDMYRSIYVFYQKYCSYAIPEPHAFEYNCCLQSKPIAWAWDKRPNYRDGDHVKSFENFQSSGFYSLKDFKQMTLKWVEEKNINGTFQDLPIAVQEDFMTVISKNSVHISPGFNLYNSKIADFVSELVYIRNRVLQAAIDYQQQGQLQYLLRSYSWRISNIYLKHADESVRQRYNDDRRFREALEIYRAGNPTNVPVESTNVTVEPTNVTVEPTNVPVEPTNVPVEPTNVTVEPIYESEEPMNVPEEPIYESVEPIYESVEPINKPAGQVNESVEQGVDMYKDKLPLSPLFGYQKMVYQTPPSGILAEIEKDRSSSPFANKVFDDSPKNVNVTPTTVDQVGIGSEVRKRSLSRSRSRSFESPISESYLDIRELARKINKHAILFFIPLSEIPYIGVIRIAIYSVIIYMEPFYLNYIMPLLVTYIIPYVEISFQIYRIYKLPSRIRNIIKIINKIYIYAKNLCSRIKNIIEIINNIYNVKNLLLTFVFIFCINLFIVNISFFNNNPIDRYYLVNSATPLLFAFIVTFLDKEDTPSFFETREKTIRCLKGKLKSIPTPSGVGIVIDKIKSFYNWLHQGHAFIFLYLLFKIEYDYSLY